jgi:uncharacterized coiled-coil protein SlyX
MRFPTPLPLLIAIAIACCASTLHAQIPQTINYQGMLADAMGKPVADGTYSMLMHLYDSPSSAVPLWTETQVIPVRGGIFNIVLGKVTPLSLPFDRTYYLGITIGAGSELAPRTALVAAPYALRARRTSYADSAFHAADASFATRAGGLVPNASGVVTSVNGTDGQVMIEGAGGTTVTRIGPRLVIHSDSTVGGITRIANIDGALALTNPTGPTTTIDVAPAGITSPMLRDGAVTQGKIATAAVSTDKLAYQSVTNDKITDLAVTQAKIADGSVQTPKIENGAVTASKLADNAVTIPKIADGAVTGAKLADGSVTGVKLTDGVITTTKLANAAVTSQKLADSTVTAQKLTVGAVTSTRIADGAVTTSKLANAGVTEEKLAPVSVGTTKIQDSSITRPKLVEAAVVAWHIAGDAVTTPKLADGAVTSDKLADSSLTADKFIRRTITSNAIAAGAVTSTELADSAVTLQKISTAGATSGRVLGYNGSAVTWVSPLPGPSGAGAPGQLTRWTGANALAGDSALVWSNSSLGIGTAAPLAQLHVQGDLGLLASVASPAGPRTAPGSGVRMHWIATQGAFRAGRADSSEWDSVKVGLYSLAAGRNTTASGTSTIALGSSTLASGDYALAAGQMAVASGHYSTALGRYVSTNGKAGAFVLGDNSTSVTTAASAINEMTMRFAGGYRLFTDNASSLGVSLGSGGTSWATISDRNRKENFAAVDGEDVLGRIRTLPVTMWNYRGQDPSIRYIGAMAQDFWQAFRLGGTDSLTISTLVYDGVNLAAVKALEQRTRTQAERIAELEQVLTTTQVRLRAMEEMQSRLLQVIERLERDADAGVRNVSTGEMPGR